ncbi:MAG: peptidyl-prolyl cis-trans isomerase [Candidatus Aureabacteria bacterium]|nr:peptidyl-prolyl cis-trans isomerase [Candidatus Auribacterota bacterium]
MFKSCKTKITFLLLLFLLLFSLSCGSKKDKESSQLLAKINEYDLTVADFANEAELTISNRDIFSDTYSAKQAFLDELITKKVLLQEAQKNNFDKEKVFMKEIERYWEQALLKVLLKRKFEELSNAVQISDKELQHEYNKMKRTIFADLIMLNNKKSAEKLAGSGNNFEKVKTSVKANIISDQTPEWFIPGDLPITIEKPLFKLKPGQISPIITFGSTWAVVRSIEEKETKIESFKKISSDLKNSLKNKKTEKKLSEWISDLKKTATINIYDNVLKEVNLK